jgi:aminodeoxyfutalosine synthase
MSIEEVLQRLRAAGLDSMPGGGAEIFAERVRQKICHDKSDAAEWLQVHRVAHGMGLRTNCTMLYGHIETLEERVDHMLRLRALQEETGGFQTFIPLAFHPDNNALMKLPGPTATDDLRTYAVARLLLHNIPHLKAYWVMLGIKTAQTALWFGADDLDGTVQEERIYHMAGAETPQTLTPPEIVRLIVDAGRTPVERDTLYNVVAEGEALLPTTPFRRAVSRKSLEIVP